MNCHLLKHGVQPFILECHSDLHEVDDDPAEAPDDSSKPAASVPGEVDVADDHDVEVPE